MTSELPQAGRLRLVNFHGVWEIVTPTHRFSLNRPYSRTVRAMLAAHGAEVLEVPNGGLYRAGSIAEGADVMLADIIAGFERAEHPATRPQPVPLTLGVDAREVWSGPGPVRVKFGNGSASDVVFVDLFHVEEGETAPHYFLSRYGLPALDGDEQMIHPLPGRKLYARASMSGAVSILCELVEDRPALLDSVEFAGVTYDLREPAPDLDPKLAAALAHNDRAGFDMVYTGSGPASERLRRVVIERTAVRFKDRSLGVTLEDCRQAAIADLIEGGEWVRAIDAAPDAAAPLSPGDNGPLHAKLDGGDWREDPPYGEREPTAADDYTADVIDAANELNAKVRAARAHGLRVSVMITGPGPDLGETDTREISVSVQQPPPAAPEPDPDLIAAREIYAERGEFFGNLNRSADEARRAVLKGECDYNVHLQTILTAIKRGRELEAVVNVDGGPAPSVRDPQPVRLCKLVGGCVCGGDTPGVRAGCSWWKG